MTTDEMTLDLTQKVKINAALGDVFRKMLHNLGEGNTDPGGNNLNLILEQWAGGRWFRDRGNGITHLWGHVQVIKPPTLLELRGPMFMSFPVLNHIELKLDEVANGVEVTLRHRALGILPPEVKDGLQHGWEYVLGTLKGSCEQ